MSRSLSPACFFAASLMVLALALTHLFTGLNNDHLALIYQTRELLAGGVPYVDYSDVNPPLIHLLYIAPVWLADTTGLPLTYVFNGYSLLWTFASLALCARLLPLRHFAIFAIALALFGASYMHHAYADRDYLLLALSAPWILLYSPWVARGTISPRLRLAIAFIAGIGFAIKPYFYVFYLFVTGYAWRREGRFNPRAPEQWPIIAFGAFYLLIVWFCFREYVVTILPMGLQTYEALSWSLLNKIGVVWHEFVLGYAPAGLLGLLIARRWHRADGFGYLLLLLLAALLSYILNAGWYYTQYPFIAMSLLLLLASAARIATAPKPLPRRAVILLSLAVLLGVSFAKPLGERIYWDVKLQHERGYPMNAHQMDQPMRRKLERHLDSHPRYLMMSTDFWNFNLMRGEKPYARVGRFDYLWPLPGILLLKQSKWADYLPQALADDLTNKKPDMVIIDLSPYKRGLPENFDILAYLLRHEGFMNVWSGYQLVDQFNDCNPNRGASCAFAIYYPVTK